MSRSSTGLTKVLYTVGVGVGVSLLSGFSYWLYKVWKRDVMPKKWRRVGTLAQINIFPIKSCGRLKLEEGSKVACEVLGLRILNFKDRCLMLIDERNKMITARVYPKMVLIEPKIKSSTELLISAPSMDTSVKIDFAALDDDNAENQTIQTDVWGVRLEAKMCGEIYDKWFSECILGKPEGLRLVYYPSQMPVRAVHPSLAKQSCASSEDTGAFGDATSYMLMNLASVTDLNSRLTQAVNPLQFRGNFHLKMDDHEPYAEDSWHWIKIGKEVIFRNVAPCTRCILPNIDILNGTRNPDGQPLKLLKSYRIWKRLGPSPVLGIHLGLRQGGYVKADDTIYVGND